MYHSFSLSVSGIKVQMGILFLGAWTHFGSLDLGLPILLFGCYYEFYKLILVAEASVFNLRFFPKLGLGKNILLLLFWWFWIGLIAY